jgi:hypothetical protein
MTFEFEYLGEFKVIFENYLGYESEEKEHAFDRNKTEVENVMQVYLQWC